MRSTHFRPAKVRKKLKTAASEVGKKIQVFMGVL